PAARLTAAYRCPPGARHGPDTAVPGSGARPSGPDRPPSPPATRGGAPPTAPAAYSAAPFRRILPGTSATSGIVPPHRPPALPGSLPQIYRPANQVENDLRKRVGDGVLRRPRRSGTGGPRPDIWDTFRPIFRTPHGEKR